MLTSSFRAVKLFINKSIFENTLELLSIWLQIYGRLPKLTSPLCLSFERNIFLSRVKIVINSKKFFYQIGALALSNFAAYTRQFAHHMGYSIIMLSQNNQNLDSTSHFDFGIHFTSCGRSQFHITLPPPPPFTKTVNPVIL